MEQLANVWLLVPALTFPESTAEAHLLTLIMRDRGGAYTTSSCPLTVATGPLESRLSVYEQRFITYIIIRFIYIRVERNFYGE